MLNNYSEEDILELIGTGENYRYKNEERYRDGKNIVGMMDRYINCGSDFDCSNNAPRSWDPYENTCGWQYWTDCYEPVVTEEEIGPDAVIFPGVSGSAAGVLYGVIGEEILWNRRSGEVSAFGYTGQGAGVALEADTAAYFGLVWNLEDNENYEGLFSTLTIDASAILGVQLNFFWIPDTVPFTGETWGFSIGGAGGGGLGITGSQTDFVCHVSWPGGC
ncbi:MAG TPA: hypothetical protein PLD25_17275 [Chloroflexota bacterium]|nr:hypothetical protein [Chloroflexota bacterium]